MTKIIEKLAKIKAHADSAKEIGNEAEAEAFAGMLQQLMLRHKLELTDIQYAEEMKTEPIIQHRPEITQVGGKMVYRDFPDVEAKIGLKRCHWGERLADVVAKCYSCQTLVTKGSNIIFFVGHTSNVMAAEYLYLKMFRAADTLSDKAAKTMRRNYRASHGVGSTPPDFRVSFISGFIVRIQELLDKGKQEFGGSANTAIIRYNREAKAVEEYMDQMQFGKAARLKSQRLRYNAEGFETGMAVADELDVTSMPTKPNQQLED